MPRGSLADGASLQPSNLETHVKCVPRPRQWGCFFELQNRRKCCYFIPALTLPRPARSGQRVHAVLFCPIAVNKFRTPDIPPSNPWKLHVFEDMGADQNLSAFSDGENADCGRSPCCCWLLRIQPRNRRLKIPVPTLAMGADQNLSAFSDGENADRGRNLRCCWLLRIHPRNRRLKIPVPTLAMGADQNLSAFWCVLDLA
jgi:hypothetical protein